MNEFKEDERRYAESAKEEKRSLDRGLLSDPISVLHPERAVIVLVGPAEMIVPQVDDLGPVEIVKP